MLCKGAGEITERVNVSIDVYITLKREEIYASIAVKGDSIVR